MEILIDQLKLRDVIPSTFNYNFEFDHNYSTFRLLMRALVTSVNPNLTKSLFADANDACRGQICLQPTIKSDSICNILSQTSFYRQNFSQICSLGKGGFGKVFLTQNRVDLAHYAVKLIQKSKQDIEFLLREAILLAKLTHPNVVRYFSSWTELYCLKEATGKTKQINLPKSPQSSSPYVVFEASQGQPEYEAWSTESSREPEDYPIWTLFIQMELCGENLKNWLDARNSAVINFPEKERQNAVIEADNITIALQLFQGLHYIHSSGIAHRDIKPGNIFLDTDTLSVKIGDFGLARHISSSSDDSDVIKLSTGVGTRIYAAPEIEKCSQYTNKCDIFSLGVVLYELYNVCCTNSERISRLRFLLTKGPSKNFARRWPRQAFLIRLMISLTPESRPTAAKLLRESRPAAANSGEEVDRLRAEIKTLKSLLAQSETRIKEQSQRIEELVHQIKSSD